jgi:hypothetical protein
MEKVKTWKRELAVALILGLGAVVYVGNLEMVKVLVWPIFTFAAAAFGLDSYAKQVQNSAGTYTTDGDTSLRK